MTALSDYLQYPIAAGKKVVGKTIGGVFAQGVIAVDDTHTALGTEANPLKVVNLSAAPITKAPAELGGGYWFYDVRYRDADNTVPTEIGDHFSLTAVPHQGSAIGIVVVSPDPADPRLFTFDYHVDATDPTTFAVLIKPNMSEPWPGSWIGTVFTGTADGTVQARSEGDGSYIQHTVTDIDRTLALPTLLQDLDLDYTGTGLDATLSGLKSVTGNHEGILDRLRAVQAVAPPTFDPTPYIGAGNGPADWGDVDWTGGKGVVVAGGDLAVLDRADPTDPFDFFVEDDLSLTAYEHPDVFNDPTKGPGNFYRLVVSSPGSPDDGTIFMWLSDDPKVHQRGGSPEAVSVTTGRWLSYAAGTPL